MPEPEDRSGSEALQAWGFVDADELWAISVDEDGGNLPPDRGPWRPHKPILLCGLDPDEREAERVIRRQGYCCFDGRDQGAAAIA